MTTLTLTSELEAINIMLEAADEAPVASLELSGLYPLEKAKRILDETMRVVQSVGWKFNTEDDYPLTRDGSNNIVLPGNALTVDINDSFTDVDPVQRGAKLYDAKGHTYTFTHDLKASVVFLLPWDAIPEPARHYINIRAARTMQGRSSVSDSTYKYSEDDEQAAFRALSESESVTGDYNMLTDSWDVAKIIIGRDMT